MRVLCRHGHIAFFPRSAGEIARFCDRFDIELIRKEDFYTFPALTDLPRYSLKGKTFGVLTAVKTYEGREPWDVLRENGFVYNISTEALVVNTSIAIQINPPLVGDFFLAQSPLIQPGSKNAIGAQILSYDGEYKEDIFQFQVTEFSYV